MQNRAKVVILQTKLIKESFEQGFSNRLWAETCWNSSY